MVAGCLAMLLTGKSFGLEFVLSFQAVANSICLSFSVHLAALHRNLVLVSS